VIWSTKMGKSYDLKIKNVIGYNGKLLDSLHYTPDGKFVIYALGPYLVLKSMDTGKESFLDGHTEAVTVLKLSHDGKRLASGQSTLPGKAAALKIWDVERACELNDAGKVMIGDDCEVRTMMQHLGKVRDLSFSAKDNFLVSLGGVDDNNVTVWRMETGEPLCGGPAHTDTALCCQFLNKREDRFVTAGTYHARVWQMDPVKKKCHVIDVKMGAVRRFIQCIAITPDDEFAMCGTETGDVLKLKIKRDEMRSYNDPDTIIPALAAASKDRLSQGVLVMRCVEHAGKVHVLCGGGDGTICFLNSMLKIDKDRCNSLLGGVTGLSIHPKTGDITAGTNQCNRYSVSRDLSRVAMLQSCHYGPINQVEFPEGSADLIITASTGDFRVWHLPSARELLRVKLPTLDCLSCCVTPTGSSIISGWSDGKIRAFAPETGKLKFSIGDAHAGPVTALAVCGDDSYSSWKLVSGGEDGRVRVWKVTPQHQVMLASLKEHRGAVNAIRVNQEQTEAISASADGSCITWDMDRYVRTMAFFESNVFKTVSYHPDESQMLTCGTNGKITYWDAVDGEAIREIEVADDFVQSCDVDPSGEFFMSGSGHRERLVKLWHYDEGLPAAVGRGHAGGINDIKFSPDMTSIASVGSAGEIMIWEMPPREELLNIMEEQKANVET